MTERAISTVTSSQACGPVAVMVSNTDLDTGMAFSKGAATGSGSRRTSCRDGSASGARGDQAAASKAEFCPLARPAAAAGLRRPRGAGRLLDHRPELRRDRRQLSALVTNERPSTAPGRPERALVSLGGASQPVPLSENGFGSALRNHMHEPSHFLHTV